MRVVIVEDELAASDNLTYMLNAIDSSVEVLKVLDSVKSSIAFFSKPHEAELVFMDIHLADGISFEIFDQVSITVPIIFTTAYDQYALKAFKFNSIDYLLKPIDDEELSDALEQFSAQIKPPGLPTDQVKGLLDLLSTKGKTYKTSFLVNQRDQMIPLKVEMLAFFRIDMGVVKAITKDNRSYTIEGKLEDIELELNPIHFYRVNRQFIIHKDAIVNIKHYFNGKLIISTNPVCNERIVVSKAKATAFKKWIGS